MKKLHLKLSKSLIDKIEEAGFSVYECEDGDIEFGKYTDVGQDFRFTIDAVDSLDELCEEIRQYYLDYDVSQEAFYWLDDSGHGKNGAPYEMVDVYKDMQQCEEFINELNEIVWDFYIETVV